MTSIRLPALFLITSTLTLTATWMFPAQPDGTVTLILSTSSGRHQVLNFASRENKTFPGPLLTIQSSGRDLN